MNKINLNSVAFLVLGVFLLLTPALSQAIITSLVTAFFRDIDLLLWVNLAQNFWILNLIPKVVGATLVAGFAWKHLKTRFKVDLPKIKVQTTRLATYSLLFMLCAGLFLFADVPVSEAATTATTGYILDTPVSEHAWLIGAYSDGTYYAINGGTWDNMVAGVGSTAWATYKTNSTKITELVLDSTTSGSIYMKDVAFDMNLFDDIPEGVRVICSYNAEYWEYINSADSSGSPYTVSVGSGVNNGYYLAQDKEGRICWLSINASYVINLVTVNGGLIFIRNGVYPLDSSILYYDNSKIVGESWDTILVLQDNVDLPVIAGSGSFTGDDSGNENVVIQNLQIDGNAVGQTELYTPNGIEYSGLVNGLFDNLYVHDCKFCGFCDYGSHYVRQGENIVIQNSRVEDCPEGVTFTFIKKLDVHDNIFEGMTLGAAIHGEASFAEDNIEDIHIHDNTITNCSAAIEVATLNPSKGYGVFIEGNKITDTAKGITLYYINQFHILGNSFNNVSLAVTSDP